MKKLLMIACGGAIGSVLRYLVSGLTHEFARSMFPWGTLVVNLSGSLMVGVFWGMFEYATGAQAWRMFLLIGVLGAYTTFSTFTLENFSLLRDGEYALAILNVILSAGLGTALVFAGFFLSRNAMGFFNN